METETQQELPVVNYDKPFEVWYTWSYGNGTLSLKLKYEDGSSIRITDFQQGVEVLTNKGCKQCLYQWMLGWGGDDV